MYREINKKSWHYRLLSFFYRESSIRNNYNDSCSYRGAVLMSMLLAVVMTALVLGVAFTLASPILSYYDILPESLIAVATFGVVLYVIAAFAVTVFYAIKVLTFIANKISSKFSGKRTYKIKKPGFIKQAYLDLKEKICVPIKFTEV